MGAPLAGWLCVLAVGTVWGVLQADAADRIRRKEAQATSAGARNLPLAPATDAPEPKSTGEEKTHPLAPALKLAAESREALNAVQNYTAVFYKEELVGRRMIKQTMDLKLREKPFSVYLYFQAPHRGREVIFVEGQNRGNLLVHEEGVKGIVGTVELLPTSPKAMDENRYPVSRLGLAKMLDSITSQWELESKFGETDVKFFPDAKVGQIPCQVIESSHPQPRKQFKFHITRLYLDKQTKLPIRVEQFAWPARSGESAPMIEMYMYGNLKTNAGLTEVDFSPRNPAYRF
jgi:hypothetical protein